MHKEEFSILIEDTPNPYATKFVTNFPLKIGGKITFYSPLECKNIPLAEELLNLTGVKQIYLSENTLTLTQDGTGDLPFIKESSVAILKKYAPIHNPYFTTKKDTNTSKKKSPPKTKKLIQIEEVLDRTIRPGLQADGGDLEVISYEKDTLKVIYQGACGGCPSAFTGTLEAIEGILRHEMKNPNLKVEPL